VSKKYFVFINWTSETIFVIGDHPHLFCNIFLITKVKNGTFKIILLQTPLITFISIKNFKQIWKYPHCNDTTIAPSCSRQIRPWLSSFRPILQPKISEDLNESRKKSLYVSKNK
jgi:hypothetical protein